MKKAAAGLEKTFDVTAEQIAEWDEMVVRGGYPGRASRRGRCRATAEIR